MLSIWLLLWISHSIFTGVLTAICVVNCFQFDYFCGYHTALFNFILSENELWIAFNLITFVDITQQWSKSYIKIQSCELLSIWLLLWISHSLVICGMFIMVVVNCFQFDYFCGYHTAWLMMGCSGHKLWIAFNLITFVDITQHAPYMPKHWKSCELLSIWLLLWISHSSNRLYCHFLTVVNCFQFDYFCGYHTAFKSKTPATRALWIAFNLITFVDITQPSFVNVDILRRCELLSIWLLLWISHSENGILPYSTQVVNCFQFDYFCGYHTALCILDINQG